MLLVILSVYYICLLVSCLSGLAAALSDFRGMKIPNILSVIIILAFFTAKTAVSVSGTDPVFSSFISHILSGIVMFGLTYMLFAFGAMGAGDSKLLTAYGFWFGLNGLPVFVFYVTMIGAVLALAALVVMRMPIPSGLPEESWLARIRARERVVAYGIAISFGAFAGFLTLNFFSVSL